MVLGAVFVPRLALPLRVTLCCRECRGSMRVIAKDVSAKIVGVEVVNIEVIGADVVGTVFFLDS